MDGSGPFASPLSASVLAGWSGASGGGVAVAMTARVAGLPPVIDALRLGNQRLLAGVAKLQPRSDSSPLVVVIVCSELKLIPELLFDQPVGALSVIRSPGVTVSPGVLDALNMQLQSPDGPEAILVLSHEGCQLGSHDATDRDPDPALDELSPEMPTGYFVRNERYGAGVAARLAARCIRTALAGPTRPPPIEVVSAVVHRHDHRVEFLDDTNA